MKILFLMICCIPLILVIIACSSEKYVVSVNGDKAEVKLINGKNFVGELVCIRDTAIIFATKPVNPLDFPQLFYEPIDKIKSITIQGYDGSGWLTSVILFQTIPAGLLTVAATSVDSDNAIVGLTLIIPAITAILFATSEGVTPQWGDELPISEMENLKKFSRYPEGMSQDVLSMILKQYNQTGITRITRR